VHPQQRRVSHVIALEPLLLLLLLLLLPLLLAASCPLLSGLPWLRCVVAVACAGGQMWMDHCAAALAQGQQTQYQHMLETPCGGGFAQKKEKR
jgi:hypothetical protein